MNPILPKTGCSPIGEPLFPSVVWGKACNTMLLNFLHSRKFLGCQLGELFRTGLARRQQSCHHVSSLFRYDVTMSLGHFHNQAVCSRSEEHTSELQSHHDLVCRLLLE